MNTLNKQLQEWLNILKNRFRLLFILIFQNRLVILSMTLIIVTCFRQTQVEDQLLKLTGGNGSNFYLEIVIMRQQILKESNMGFWISQMIRKVLKIVWDMDHLIWFSKGKLEIDVLSQTLEPEIKMK